MAVITATTVVVGLESDSRRLWLGHAMQALIDRSIGDGSRLAAVQSFEPPSPRTVSPEIQRAASEARNATTGPMASGGARRLSACMPRAGSRPAVALGNLA